ncbi:MAG: leucyl/phenylalanyl-tRNA--protein transferase [Pyrinomonadaceae bacterium]
MSFSDPAKYEFPEWVLLDDYFYYAKDVVSFGDELTIDNLRLAYRMGIFPWHMEGVPLPWFCPDPRAILRFKDLHVPKSLEKEKRRGRYSYTIDGDFRTVIVECSHADRKGQKGTWITGDFVNIYTDLHKAGMAHSVEVWNGEGLLVGGLYGVDAGGVFCGESMFHLEPNTSKLALLFLIDHLKSRGSTWLDAQVMTPHMRILGAKEISRKEFLRRLRETQGFELDLFDSKARRAPR